MIRPPMLEEIDGQYMLVEQPRPWRLWLRRVGCWCIVLAVVLCAVLVVAMGW